MKGVILAGGTGSRLAPLTSIHNKHLLPVGRYPMIVYPLLRLIRAGITDILIITGDAHLGDIARFLGNGTRFGAQICYRTQDSAGGIAQALYLAKPFVQDDQCLVVLGDNIFTDNLKPYVDTFQSVSQGAFVFLKRVGDPKRYGVPCIQDGRIIAIEEKPANPKSEYAVTGIYMYDQDVFRIIEGLSPSERGEYEITDVNNIYIQNGQLQYGILHGEWIDAGTFESLEMANRLMQNEIFPEFSYY